MQTNGSLRTILERLPLFRPLIERHFARTTGSFRGIYKTFAEADQSAPKTKPRGFNCLEYTHEFQDRHNRIFSFDYPVIYWLSRLLRPSCRIFDYGGHLGTHFYAYSRYLAYPEGLSWTVCDLPEITQAGEELARSRNIPGIRFTNCTADATGSDILIAAGSLQYIESPPFAATLTAMDCPPPHLLLNKLPLHSGRQFVTLQNGGAAFHPQYAFNRADFLQSLTTIGYELIDSWSVETHSGYIPGHPKESFRCHSGLYLALKGRPNEECAERNNSATMEKL